MNLHAQSQIKTFKEVSDYLNLASSQNQDIEGVSYNASFLAITPTIEDSIFQTYGSAKIILNSDDTIFGSEYVLKVNSVYGENEYLYDGIKNYDINHTDKSITIYDTHSYRKNETNRAIHNVALKITTEYLLSSNLDGLLLTSEIDNAEIKYLDSLVKIKLTYLPNEFNQVESKILTFNSVTNRLLSYHKYVLFNEAVFKEMLELKNVVVIRNRASNTISFSAYLEGSNHYKILHADDYFNRESSDHKSRIGTKIKRINGKYLNGSDFQLSKYSGAITLVNFWESWCGYCLLSMDNLNTLSTEYDDRFKIIGIVSENIDQIKIIAQNKGLKYDNVIVSKEQIESLGITSRPTYLLINAQAEIIAESIGDLEIIKRKLQEIMK